MTREQAIRAIESRSDARRGGLDGGADLLATGEMGIGNTTVASAIAAAITGAAAERVTGRGTGVDDATLARKVAVVRQALEVNRPTRVMGSTCSRRSAASRSVASSA